MKRKLPLAMSAALLIAVAASAEDAKATQSQPKEPVTGTFSRPKLEPYLDDSTGAEFPPEIDGLIKTQVVKNSNPYYGTVVRYAALDGSCADVYIYSLGQAPDHDTLNAHFKGVLKVIAKLPGGTGPVKSISFQKELEVKLGSKGSIDAKKAVFSFEAAGGSSFNSDLVIFAFRDKVVKIRVSRPLGVQTYAEPFEAEIASLFEAASAKSSASDDKTNSNNSH